MKKKKLPIYNFKESIQGTGPREKLIKHGADRLSNSELLAIIFTTGTREENVLELSNRVFQEYGSRSITSIRDVNKVIDLLGLGSAKAAQLVATFELGRRFFEEQSSRMPSIMDPKDVFDLLQHMRNLKKEELRVLYLNSRQKLIREELISLGNENTNFITPKEILHPAVELMARGIILVHNHPSGNTSPSDADINFTKKIQQACDIIGIEFLDHIIIGSDGFSSLVIEKLV